MTGREEENVPDEHAPLRYGEADDTFWLPRAATDKNRASTIGLAETGEIQWTLETSSKPS